MSDLHARITAAIDQAEALARRAWDAEPGRWALHHNQTRYGRADEWEIRDYDGDALAWVGAENDARLIVAHASPDVVLRGLAEDRDILRVVHKLRQHAAFRREHAQQSGWADDLETYAAELEASVARRHGIEAS